MTIHRPLQHASAILVLAGLLAGCSVAGLATGVGTIKTGAGGTTATGGTGATGTGAGGTTVGTTGQPVHNQPLEALAGVEFKPVSEVNARFLAANGNSIVAAGGGNIVSGSSSSLGATSGAQNAAPMAASAPMAAGAPMAPGVSGADSKASLGNSATSAVAIAARPVPPPNPTGGLPPGSHGGAFSGNVDAYYGYNSYFGGSGFGGDQQMALVSLQQAETPGASGGFAQVLAAAAAPVVKAWANDARLIHSNALLDNKGVLVPAQNNYPGGGPMMAMPMKGGYIGPNGNNDGWSLTYISSNRSEVLTFAITPAKTTILRMRWQPLDLAPERVTTDSGAAIQKLIAAIQDKSFAGEEEKTGKDYFLGFAFLQPQTGQYDGNYQKTEVVYQVPDDARWNVNLQEVMGRVVWDLSFYANNNMVAYGATEGGIGFASSGVAISGGAPAPNGASVAAAPPATKYGVQQVATATTTTAIAYPTYIKPDGGPTPVNGGCGPQLVSSGGYFNNSARGMVDAETGAVIRFTRPTRTSYQQEVYPPCVAPMPIPLPASPSTPSPQTTASSAPSAKPTP